MTFGFSSQSQIHIGNGTGFNGVDVIGYTIPEGYEGYCLRAIAWKQLCSRHTSAICRVASQYWLSDPTIYICSAYD